MCVHLIVIGVGLSGPCGVPLRMDNIPEQKDIHVPKCKCRPEAMLL